jgi:hypothetical protein
MASVHRPGNQSSPAEQHRPMLTKLWPLFISLAIGYHLLSSIDLC